MNIKNWLRLVALVFAVVLIFFGVLRVTFSPIVPTDDESRHENLGRPNPISHYRSVGAIYLVAGVLILLGVGLSRKKK